jgi:alpha,alpha-trehalase
MWMYPAGWASTQLMVVEGLDAYGFAEAAQRISSRFLSLLLEQYRKTGQLWEKYNVVDGSLVLPNSRYGNIPYHSFTAAAVVLLGRRAFENRRLR